MKSILLAAAIPALTAALPASTSSKEAEVIWDASATADVSTGSSFRDESAPAQEDYMEAGIVGGYQAFPGEFSNYGVSSQWRETQLRRRNDQCQHRFDRCSLRRNGRNFHVVAGTNQWRFGGVRSGVPQVIIHGGYDSRTSDNDFAILKLSTPIAQSENIAYALLPPAGSDPAPNTPATVAGWGATRTNGQATEDLMAVQVPTVYPDTCARVLAPELFSQNMICAGYPEGGRDACQGDSGGPLYDDFTGEVIGVVSWGLNGCAAPQSPGVYARVGRAIGFIQRWS